MSPLPVSPFTAGSRRSGRLSEFPGVVTAQVPGMGTRSRWPQCYRAAVSALEGEWAQQLGTEDIELLRALLTRLVAIVGP